MDVFISYSHHDAQWVRGVLKSRIELWGLEVRIDHDDFLPGQRLAGTVRESLTSARHVVFVCSPSFVSSEWCREEVETVRSQDPGSLKAKALPVVLDRKGVPDLLIDTIWCDLSLDREDEHEWQKLRRSLLLSKDSKISRLKEVYDSQRDRLKKTYVLEMVAQLGGRDELSWLKWIAENDYENECRELAVSEVVRLDASNQVPWLKHLVVDDRWSSVRTKALRAIASISTERHADWIEQMLHGGSESDIRREAFAILAKHRKTSDSFVDWLQELANEEEDSLLSRQIIDILVEAGGDRQLDNLRELAQRTNNASICLNVCDRILNRLPVDEIAVTCLKGIVHSKVGYSAKEDALRRLSEMEIDPFSEWLAPILDGNTETAKQLAPPDKE